MPNRIRFAALVIGSLTLGAGAHAQTRPPTPAPAAAVTTPEFLKTAAASDEFERRSGLLATRQAQDPKVKEFAQHMVAAHTETTKELGQAAQEAGQRAPTPQLSPDQESKLAALTQAQGAAFDRLYVEQQQAAHQEALSLMQGYANGGHDAALRTAAAKTAPLVQQHLATLASLQQAAH